MTKVILLGVQGDPAIWMVDLDRKTVSAVPQNEADTLTQGTRPMIKGVDFAVAVDQNSQVAAGKFDTVELSKLT